MKISRWAYWKKTENKFQKGKDAVRDLWEHELNMEIPQPTCESYLYNVNRITISTKLRYFQYRHLNRIVKTNIDLCKLKPEISDTCFFCYTNRETVYHLLCNGPKISAICDKVCSF